MATTTSSNSRHTALYDPCESRDILTHFQEFGDFTEIATTSEDRISPSSVCPDESLKTSIERPNPENPSPIVSNPKSPPEFDRDLARNFEFSPSGLAGQNDSGVSVPENEIDNTESRPKDLNVGELLGASPLGNDYPRICQCSACALPSVVIPRTASASSLSSVAAGSAGLDLSRTFFLNSLAGANHTIYLDFNGHNTTGTSWNTAYGRSTIDTPAFDPDNNGASFSNAELERIQYIWQRVAEDFIPFNVNVTTQAPADINDLIKSGTGDSRWGVRVAIGGSSYDWYGAGAGGVAYVGSFNWNSDTPTFVFEDQLGNGDEKYTAEAISHEVGHTLGLYHDGRSNPSEGYYYGHGSGETGWAPIMGAGYYQDLTQWSRGQYASANNTEDDLAIITANNGFGYRSDDVGNSIATAGLLTVSGTTVSAQGIIERNTDVDFYRFSTGTGAISLAVNPFSRGPDLDISLQLYNSAGGLIASSNPIDSLSSSISATVAAGDYYLAIDGTGKGDPLATGYTDYGSLGQYSINGSIVPPNVSTRDEIFIRSPQYAGLLSYNGSGFQANSVQYSWIGGWKLDGTDRQFVGDFNGDNRDDVFIRSPQYAGLLAYNGSGFQANSVQSGWIGGWQLSGTDQQFVGDFNGDNRDDVFIRSPQYAGLLTYNGSGFQSASVQYSWIGGWKLDGTDRQFVGDFNGDGKDDVFIRSPQYAGLLTYNGSGFQANSVQYDWIGGWKLNGTDQQFVGDFNGDGKDDIFIRSPQYAGLLTYNGSGFQANSIQYDWIGGGWKLDGTDQHFVGDFNGDGKDDIFIRSPEYAGLLTYNGSGFQANSIQYDWIGGWNLATGDQQFVGNFV